ncbi:hypothetical protein [Bradyrhizobium sp. sGM-13]|uniref:hypothetical protein n=1 Tax=Bradyrhizobium sp. sGM-13 TaxID=2831781 RepID=UPI001BCAB3F4|nr:hypothetical protein [Bradyrhizobium sp. sGM-13]
MAPEQKQQGEGDGYRDVVSDGWRTNLYVCDQRDFPLYARLRVIKDNMGFPVADGTTITDFSGIISGWMDSGSNCMGLVIKKQDRKISEPTTKNILGGYVNGNPKYPKGGSVIRDDYLIRSEPGLIP